MRSCSLTPVLQKSCKLSIKWQNTLPQLMECQNVCFNLCILKIKKTLSYSVARCQAIKTTTTSWENKKQYVSSYRLMRHKHIYCICVCSGVRTHTCIGLTQIVGLFWFAYTWAAMYLATFWQLRNFFAY